MTDLLVIPYGTSHVSPSQTAAIAAGTLDELNRPAAPIAVIDRTAGMPLRLSDVTHPFTRPPAAQDLAHGAGQLASLREHLLGLCGRGRSLRALLGAYFDAVTAQLEARADELATRAGAVSGLVEHAHWIFCAPMPLPRAHVPAPGGDMPFQDCDLAFWDGDGLVCCFVESGTPVGARRRAMEALSAVARIERLAPNEAPGKLLDRLGPRFGDVTRGVGLPRSPFRGLGVPRPG